MLLGPVSVIFVIASSIFTNIMFFPRVRGLGLVAMMSVPIVLNLLNSNCYSFFCSFFNQCFSQFDTVNDIPKKSFAKQKVIYGIVERVIDGDTIRVRHCRTRFHNPKPDPAVKRIYDSTLSIRIYGVDAPELQKRKSDPPSQPFAQEATDIMSNLVMGQKVRIKLLRRDQYGRAVAKVQAGRHILPPFDRLDVSVELAQQGLATLYTGGGAEYDGKRELLETKEAQAKKNKAGVWSQGDNMMSPAEFKRQQKQLKKQGVVATVY
jgi:endonuclease YncB( thermonuclease family)